MNRLNEVRDNLVSVSVVWLAAVAAVGMAGVVGGTWAVAAESSVAPAVLTKTLATPVVAGPMPWPVVIETLVVYEVGRYAWHKYDGPKVVRKCYEETRQAVGWAVRSVGSAAKAVTRATLQTVKESSSRMEAAYRWLRE